MARRTRAAGSASTIWQVYEDLLGLTRADVITLCAVGAI